MSLGRPLFFSTYVTKLCQLLTLYRIRCCGLVHLPDNHEKTRRVQFVSGQGPEVAAHLVAELANKLCYCRKMASKCRSPLVLTRRICFNRCIDLNSRGATSGALLFVL